MSNQSSQQQHATNTPESRAFIFIRQQVRKTDFIRYNTASENKKRRNLTQSADGAVKAAVEALTVVSSATQGVPYLGAISTALTAILKIKDVRMSRAFILEITYSVLGGQSVQR
jgi:hypothetical protein